MCPKRKPLHLQKKKARLEFGGENVDKNYVFLRDNFKTKMGGHQNRGHVWH